MHRHFIISSFKSRAPPPNMQLGQADSPPRMPADCAAPLQPVVVMT